MVQVRQHILTAVFLLACTAEARKFYPDDPLAAWPKPVPVDKISLRETDSLYDFLAQSFGGKPPSGKPALAVNTLGEVPDSAWYTNRHVRRRMSPEELRRGPGSDHRPSPPFVVVGAKTDGITPGFRMTDSAGRLYFVKPDPYSNPEMATAADVVGSKFFYALGYYTPENYILNLDRSQLKVSPKARVNGLGGRKRNMLERDIDDILRALRRRPDGTYRMLASLGLAGQPLGPFRYEDTRTEDPNDTVPHQLRRDLRGLFVFCAWLNHTDAKGINSYDTLVEENGVKFVRHHLLDFGAILGSDSDMRKNARFGHEYIIPGPGPAFKDMFSLGLAPGRWEHARYPDFPAVGRFESKGFNPDEWRPNYPNPAFIERLPDDEFWAAKQVAMFTDGEIRTLVETGEYSDPKVVDYLVQTLAERRDLIGKTFFAKVLPLDRFRVERGELKFDDLAVERGYSPARRYTARWSRFDNESETLSELPGETSFRLPSEMAGASAGRYFAVSIQAQAEVKPSAGNKSVLVYLRTTSGASVVVGIDRKW